MATKKSPTWLERRRDFLTASDCAAALGLDPYKTPYQLWAEKQGAPGSEASESAAIGNELEDRVLDFAEREAQRGLVLPEGAAEIIDAERANVEILEHLDDPAGKKALVVSTVYEGLAYSPDGFFETWAPLPDLETPQDELAGPGNVQAKTAGTENYRDAKGVKRTWTDDGPPARVLVQTTVEAAIAGLGWSTVPLLFGGRGGLRFRVYDVPVHPRADELLERLAEWRRVHLVEGVEPEPLGTSGELEAWKRWAPTEIRGKVATLDAERFEPVVDRYLELAARIGRWEKEKDALGSLIKTAIGEAEYAYLGGTRVGFSLKSRTRKASRASTYRHLQRMKPEDVETLAVNPEAPSEEEDALAETEA